MFFSKVIKKNNTEKTNITIIMIKIMIHVTVCKLKSKNKNIFKFFYKIGAFDLEKKQYYHM